LNTLKNQGLALNKAMNNYEIIDIKRCVLRTTPPSIYEPIQDKLDELKENYDLLLKDE